MDAAAKSVCDAYIPAGDWRGIDSAIVRLAANKGEFDYDEGRWLLAARRAAVHARLGFGSFAQYVEWRLGYDPRATAEMVRPPAACASAMPTVRRTARAARRLCRLCRLPRI